MWEEMLDQGSMKQHPGGTGFGTKKGNWAQQGACSVRGKAAGLLREQQRGQRGHVVTRLTVGSTERLVGLTGVPRVTPPLRK